MVGFLDVNHPKQIAFISKDFKKELRNELKFLDLEVLQETETAFWLMEDSCEPVWAQGLWRDVKAIEFTSITDAQKKLKEISPIWRYYGDQFFRRGELIAEKLNTVVETDEYHFTAGVVKKMPPVFTLVEPNLMFYSPKVSRPSLNGLMKFKENKTAPPSRAYLKLWEALTILGDWPNKTHSVVDLGSSPGSWTWALAKLGASVLSIDRSSLDPSLKTFSNIHFQSGDAFALAPEKKDWIFSDVICYPEKLYEYMLGWIRSGHCEKFVCSIKFAGEPDSAIIKKFQEIPHSRVIHLTHNKNEVTWIRHPKIKGLISSSCAVE
jgi:23S rRNA (cytidine2498-2'-O)-methyltransferase